MVNLEYAKCPKCDKVANGKSQVDELFGIRIQQGKYPTVQSWCKDCRG